MKKADLRRRLTLTSAVIVGIGTTFAAGCGEGGEPALVAPHAATDPVSEQLVGQHVSELSVDGIITQGRDVAGFDRFAGEPVLLSFIYTRCPSADECPLLVQKMQAVQQRLQEAGNSGRFVAVSFDPDADTPEALTEYGRHHGVDYTSWEFWTGDSTAIERLADRLGIDTTRGPGGVIVHNMRTFAIDSQGVIRFVYRQSDWPVAEIAQVMQQLDAGER